MDAAIAVFAEPVSTIIKAYIQSILEPVGFGPHDTQSATTYLCAAKFDLGFETAVCAAEKV